MSTLGIEVFKGNTRDNKTISDQIEKIKQKFGARNIVIVGDKGMIKNDQIKEMNNEGFYFITTITKPQIRKMLQEGALQMSLFDSEITEIEDAETNLRYIFRRNPIRAMEIEANRNSKIESVNKKISASNKYLKEHKRATLEVQLKSLNAYVILKTG